MQMQNNFKIGIYSLGLIGGSIYKSLQKAGGAELFLCTRNQETVNLLKRQGAKISDTPEILSDCDIIFVCSPISETINSIKKIFSINQQSLYVDVASLKADIVQKTSEIPDCRFLGSHPMAGTENSGYCAATENLFEETVWVITPTEKTNENDVNLLKLIISLMGAKPMVMDAIEHDNAVAKISHLPMLLAQSLILSAQNDNKSLTLASSGYRDMTRLALSNKIMAKDMLCLNKDNIKKALEDVVKNAQNLLNSDFFDENIDKIISTRARLYNSSGKNNFRSNE